MQLVGAALAVLFLRVVIDVSGIYGSNSPASGYSAGDAFLMEAGLALGLVSVILGTASGAQNIGIFGAIGVGAYIVLAGLWGSPISGALMNPARTFGPDLVGKDFTDYWVMSRGRSWVPCSR
ncbi:MAG TPA: aquaporin [Gaiellaceae bacterium]